MSKIEQQLQKIKAEKRLGLMTHIVVGYPSLRASRQLALTMAQAGVDFIELQIPFSDPVADGPTLMRANEIALKNRTTVQDAMDLMTELSALLTIPLIFMTYFNIVHRYGVKRFCLDSAAAGASGLIVPDMPLDEELQENFIAAAERSGLIIIRLLSPASNERRLALNAELAEGFIYYVSRKGTTGAQTDLDPELNERLKLVKKFIDLPLAVGFGISSAEHLTALKGHAEIAVVGSGVIDTYNKANKDGAILAVSGFIKSLIAEL